MKRVYVAGMLPSRIAQGRAALCLLAAVSTVTSGQCVGLPAPPVLIDDARSTSASSATRFGSGADQAESPNPDFSYFDSVISSFNASSGGYATGFAMQRSSVAPMDFVAGGVAGADAGASGEADRRAAVGFGESLFRVTFLTSSDYHFSFVGSGEVELTSLAGEIIALSQDGPEISRTGILAPGEYTLRAVASARAFVYSDDDSQPTANAADQFGFRFQLSPVGVSDPSSMGVLFGLGLTILLLNRCKCKPVEARALSPSGSTGFRGDRIGIAPGCRDPRRRFG